MDDLQMEYLRNQQQLQRQEQQLKNLNNLRLQIQVQEMQRDQLRDNLSKGLKKEEKDYKKMFYKGAMLLGAMSLVPIAAVGVGRRRRDVKFDLPLPFSLPDALPTAIPQSHPHLASGINTYPFPTSLHTSNYSTTSRLFPRDRMANHTLTGTIPYVILQHHKHHSPALHNNKKVHNYHHHSPELHSSNITFEAVVDVLKEKEKTLLKEESLQDLKTLLPPPAALRDPGCLHRAFCKLMVDLEGTPYYKHFLDHYLQ